MLNLNSGFPFHTLYDITILRYSLYSNFIDKPLSKAHYSKLIVCRFLARYVSKFKIESFGTLVYL